MICCSDMDTSNYAEFRMSESDSWFPSPYCSQCIADNFIMKQWSRYLELVHKADCAAALRRLLSKPVPTHVSDRGFASDENPEGRVHSFWFSDQDRIVSARLEGSLEGEALEAFVKQQHEMLAAFEVAEAAAKAESS